MSQPKGPVYAFVFSAIVCLICSLILSISATSLKPKQVANIKLDVMQNLLSAVGYKLEDLQKMPHDAVFEIYNRDFKALLLDRNNQVQENQFMAEELIKLGFDPTEIKSLDTADLLVRFNSKKSILASRAGQSLEAYDRGYKLLYQYYKDGELSAYVVPIMGYGLWDIIKGYVALDTDLNRITGISFYEHKETPGLGAVITEDWFKDNYKGKQILDEHGSLVSVSVAKGKVEDSIQDPAKRTHFVDGISGATLTGKGITQFMKKDLELFEPYFKTVRTQAK